MVTGYLVTCGFIREEDGIYDACMAARRRLFGYQQAPTLRIPRTDATGRLTIQIAVAHGCLVASLEEADELRGEMEKLFPNRTWSIEQRVFEEAQDISWYRG